MQFSIEKWILFIQQGKWGRYFIVYILKWEQVDGAVKKLESHYDEIIKEDKHFLSL